jgi:ParB-like chromosome segregation protein Spo0J
MKITDLKPNPNNPRIIKDDKFKKLVTSLSDFPEMMEKRPMVCVTDTDGKLYPLGGNMRLRAFKELKYKEIPDSWIILADEWSEEKRKEFTIKDNVGFGEWDFDTLANEWNVEELAEWGLDIPMLNDKDEQQEIEDLFNIELPFYTPSEDLPNVNDLADVSKTQELNAQIDLLKIDEELKEILKIRASFFTDFNFQKIADYYAQQTDEVKELFEELGMVILAPKEALERGFINLKNEITDEWTSMF